MMKKIKPHITALWLLICLGISALHSCDDTQSAESGPTVTIQLETGSRADTEQGKGDENKITRLRVLVFHLGGRLDAQTGCINNPGSIPYTRPLTITSGDKVFVTIGNEYPAMKNALDNITHIDELDDLSKLKWDHSLVNASELPFAIREYKRVPSVDGTVVPLSLKRAVGKIELRMVKDVANTQSVTLNSVQVLRAAKQSRLMERKDKTYTGSIEDWNEKSLTVPVTNTTAPTNAVYSAYLYEYASDVENQATALRLKYTVGSDNKTVDIPIKGDPRDANRFAVERNVIVKIEATVTGKEEGGLKVVSDIVSWEAMELGEEVEGLYTLILSHTNLRYAGDFGGGNATTMERSVTITATCDTPNRKWKAESPNSWITILTDTGNADGNATELKYTIEKDKTLSVEREGKIFVTLGTVKKEIKITQYPGAAIKAIGVDTIYIIDPYKVFEFTIEAETSWKAEIHRDPNNLYGSLLTTSGEAGSTQFQFTINNVPFGVDADDTVIRISPTNEEFEYFDVILCIGDFHYACDKRISIYSNVIIGTAYATWYELANVPDFDTGTEIPPLGPQRNPAHVFSCANLPSKTGKPWRLPTIEELRDMQTNTPVYFSLDSWGSHWYWSATSNPNKSNQAYTISAVENRERSEAKTNRDFMAVRCVRDR